MKISLSMYDINQALVFSNQDFFEEFMKQLHNVYVIYFSSGKIVEAQAIQETMVQIELQRDEWIKEVNENTTSILQKWLDNNE